MARGGKSGRKARGRPKKFGITVTEKSDGVKKRGPTSTSDAIKTKSMEGVLGVVPINFSGSKSEEGDLASEHEAVVTAFVDANMDMVKSVQQNA